MKKEVLVFLLVTCMSAKAGTMTMDNMRAQLAAAAQASGTNYIQQRNQVVSLGTNVVPILKRLQATNETWQIQLMAGICLERIERGNEIQSLVMKDWRKDPEWKEHWDLASPNVPSYELCKPLMVKRYKEAGLWHNGVELFWKQTKERPDVGPDMNDREWNDLILTILEGSPVIELLARSMEDQMLQSGPSWSSLDYLKKNNVHSCLPALLKIIGTNIDPQKTDVQRAMLDYVSALMTDDDLPLIDTFITQHAGSLQGLERSLLKGRLQEMKAAKSK